jgi:hypothetical protein
MKYDLNFSFLSMKTFKLAVAIILFSACFDLSAQSSAEERTVADVVNRLFKGMETRDTSLMRSTFSKEITMVSFSKDKNNEVVLKKEESILPWLKGVAAPHETYYEETWDLKVQVDGEFAQAWCDYAFYLGRVFHHCGVDAFQLYKSKDGWKIFQLADTRRKEGCNIPKQISDKHSK